MDQSRIALCMLLLGVCFVIPYAPEAFKGSFPTNDDIQQPTIGRSILSEESFRYTILIIASISVPSSFGCVLLCRVLFERKIRLNIPDLAFPAVGDWPV